MSFDPIRPVGNCPDISSEITKNSCWDDIRVTIHHDAVCDLDEVRRAIPILLYPGELHELRALPSGHGQIISVDELDATCLAVQAVCNQTVYYSLNPIHMGAARANAKTVSTRGWFFIDIDSAHSRDTSTTDIEKNAAWEVMNAVLGYLADLHWPMPILIDSGNGYHLLYRINLPNNALAQEIIKGCLEHLAFRHNTIGATIDSAVHDAARIAKLPGTWSRKGISTPDRPHRLCRLIEAPEKPETVPIEKLQELSQLSTLKKNENGSTTWDDVVTKNSKGLASYIQSAIEREGYRILSATEGNRNNTLNRAAFSIGTMAAWPEMHAEEAKAQLIRDGEHAGLTPRECLLTVNSGWTAGEKEPRPRPLDPQRNGKHEDKKYTGKLTIGADEVDPKITKWIWPDRIAYGFISIFAGRTGVGKSFVLCDVAARLSIGKSFPDNSSAKQITGTLFISEDPYQYVLVPRLMELGADRKQIGFMRWEAMASYRLSDIDYLETAWKERKEPGLIVIDPPANFLGGKDEHRNSEVREILMKLVKWLDDKSEQGKDVAIALITHYNKGSTQKALDALDRIMGSVAWASSARVACGFVVDPENQSRCIFGGIKNNLGPKATGLSYEIVKTSTLATVVWHGKSDTTFEDAMSNVGSKKKTILKWFIERFREKLEWPSTELIALAESNGYKRHACFDAKNVLKWEHRATRDAYGRMVKDGYIWFVTQDWEHFQDKKTDAGDAGENESPKSNNTNNINSEIQRRDAGYTLVNNGDSSVSSVASVASVGEYSPGVDSGGFSHEVISAIRWLSGILGKTPKQVLQIEELGNKLLIDPETLREAANVLKVELTIENGLELWSIQ